MYLFSYIQAEIETIWWNLCILVHEAEVDIRFVASNSAVKGEFKGNRSLATFYPFLNLLL